MQSRQATSTINVSALPTKPQTMSFDSFAFESSLIISSCSPSSQTNNKKRKLSAKSANYEEQATAILSNEEFISDLSVNIPSTKKNKTVESFTSQSSPTKKTLPLIQLGDKKTQDEFPMNPMRLDTSAFTAIESNMMTCFSDIQDIVNELNNDDILSEMYLPSMSSFTKKDLDQAMALLNQ